MNRDKLKIILAKKLVETYISLLFPTKKGLGQRLGQFLGDFLGILGVDLPLLVSSGYPFFNRIGRGGYAKSQGG